MFLTSMQAWPLWSGEAYFYPAYDDDEAIYDDLYNELKEAIANLNPNGDYVSADLFYGKNAFYPKSTATDQVAQWKKLGNSLLLRLGNALLQIQSYQGCIYCV